jgi:hypothetical protein
LTISCRDVALGASAGSRERTEWPNAGPLILTKTRPGDVFHQRRLAVAGRRNEKKKAHEVGAFLLAGDADLFREVGSDEREINLRDELVADERGHDLRLQLAEAKAFALALENGVPRLLAGAIGGHAHALEMTEPGEKLVEMKLERAIVDAWMLA